MVSRTQRPDAPVVHANEALHRRLIAQRANSSLSKDGTDGMSAPLNLAQYAAADLPDPTLWEGAAVYVSDEGIAAYSNGVAWSRVAGGSLLYVHRNGVAQTVTATVYTKIEFTTVAIDQAGWWDAGNYRYTPQLPGYYQTIVSAHCTGPSLDAAQAAIWLSGGYFALGSYVRANGAGGSWSQATAIVPIAVGDYIEGVAYPPDTNIQGDVISTYMQIMRVG